MVKTPESTADSFQLGVPFELGIPPSVTIISTNILESMKREQNGFQMHQEILVAPREESSVVIAAEPDFDLSDIATQLNRKKGSRRLAIAGGIALAVVAAFPGVAHAWGSWDGNPPPYYVTHPEHHRQPPQPQCTFNNDFGPLEAALGVGLTGPCLDDEHQDPNPLAPSGNMIQRTLLPGENGATGLFNKDARNEVIAFTDGARTWELGPDGKVYVRANNEVFPWESGYPYPVRRDGGKFIYTNPDGSVSVISISYVCTDSVTHQQVACTPEDIAAAAHSSFKRDGYDNGNPYPNLDDSRWGETSAPGEHWTWGDEKKVEQAA